AAIAAAHAKRHLLYCGEHDHALGFIDEALGDVVGDVEYFLEHRRGFAKAIFLLALRGRVRGESESKEQNQKLLHTVQSTGFDPDRPRLIAAAPADSAPDLPFAF